MTARAFDGALIFSLPLVKTRIASLAALIIAELVGFPHNCGSEPTFRPAGRRNFKCGGAPVDRDTMSLARL